MRFLSSACAVALIAVAAPGFSQDAATATSGASAGEAGVAPMSGTSSANYVARAADSDMYEIQSSRLALSKSKSAHVKMIAREMIADHTKTTKTLMAALPKTSPRLTRPPTALSADSAAMMSQLRQASSGEFETLYLQQQSQAHQKAWALHKGYANDGADPALKQVALSAVPIIEKHLQHLKGMPAGGTSGT